MKATTTALDLAKSSKEALERIMPAVTDATKRLAELSTHPEAKSARIVTAITQIQEALKFADVARKTVTRLAGAGLAMQPQATIELNELEIAAISYGVVQMEAPSV